MTSKNSEQHTTIDTQHLCRLARLALAPAQHQTLQHDLQRIMSMIDAMLDVDTRAVEPLTNPLEAITRLRADQVTEAVNREIFQALAPDTAEGLYLVPLVVE